MSRKLISVCLAFVSLLIVSTVVHAEDAYEIMKKVDDRYEGDFAKNRMVMILIDKQQKQRVREFVGLAKRTGEVEKQVFQFVSPPDMKNTGFLTFNWKDNTKDDDQWLYLPALGKVKRISSDDKDGSFLGSDFTYGDITGNDLDDFNYKLVGEKKIGEYEVYEIISTPKTKAIQAEYGYRKIRSFVAKDIWITVQSQLYTTRPKESKVFKAKEIKKIDGVWTIQRLEMTTYQGRKMKHASVLILKDIEYNQPVEERYFTERTLLQGV